MSSERLHIIFNEQVRPLLDGLARDKEVDLEEAIDVYQVLQALKKKIEDRLKQVKPVIEEGARRMGVESDKGHLTLHMNGAKAMIQARTSREPDPEGLKGYLDEVGIEHERVFDVITMHRYNPSKAKELVDRGFLDEERLEKLKGRQEALCVYRSKEWKDLFGDTEEERGKLVKVEDIF